MQDQDIRIFLDDVKGLITALHTYQHPAPPRSPFEELEAECFVTRFSYTYTSIESTLIHLRLLPSIIENDEWDTAETHWSTSAQPHPVEGHIVTIIDPQTPFTVHAYNKETKCIIRIYADPSYDRINIVLYTPNGTSAEDVYEYINDLFFNPDPFEGRVIRIDDEGASIVHLEDPENLSPYEPEVEQAVSWMISIANEETAEKLRNLSLPTRAGLLLEGPPGAGKTTLVRRVAKELEGNVTVLYPSAATSINTVANEIQKYDKVLVILEDVESFFGERGNEKFSDFLNTVDGLNPDNVIMFLATTNDSSQFDPAVRRPGRLERSVSITHVFQDALTDIVSQRIPQADTNKVIEALREKYGEREITMAGIDYLARSIIMEDVAPEKVPDYIKNQWSIDASGHNYVEY